MRVAHDSQSRAQIAEQFSAGSDQREHTWGPGADRASKCERTHAIQAAAQRTHIQKSGKFQAKPTKTNANALGDGLFDRLFSLGLLYLIFNFSGFSLVFSFGPLFLGFSDYLVFGFRFSSLYSLGFILIWAQHLDLFVILACDEQI